MTTHFMTTFLPILATADSISVKDLEENFQQVLMQNLAGGLRNLNDGKFIFLTNESVNEVCRWFGVTCRTKTVLSIIWEMSQQITICLAYIPPRVETCILRGHRSDHPFGSRLLPKSLVVFRVHSCQMTGSLELGLLPPQLREFRSVNNYMEGTLYLHNMPASLLIIDLRNNLITSIVGSENCLPKNVLMVEVKTFKKSIKYVSLDKSPMDTRIHI